MTYFMQFFQESSHQQHQQISSPQIISRTSLCLHKCMIKSWWENWWGIFEFPFERSDKQCLHLHVAQLVELLSHNSDLVGSILTSDARCLEFASSLQERVGFLQVPQSPPILQTPVSLYINWPLVCGWVVESGERGGEVMGIWGKSNGFSVKLVLISWHRPGGKSACFPAHETATW